MTIIYQRCTSCYGQGGRQNSQYNTYYQRYQYKWKDCFNCGGSGRTRDYYAQRRQRQKQIKQQQQKILKQRQQKRIKQQQQKINKIKQKKQKQYQEYKLKQQQYQKYKQKYINISSNTYDHQNYQHKQKTNLLNIKGEQFIKCGTCDGKGYNQDNPSIKCKKCQGKGLKKINIDTLNYPHKKYAQSKKQQQIKQPLLKIQNQIYKKQKQFIKCAFCDGTGYVQNNDRKCKKCQGTGRKQINISTLNYPHNYNKKAQYNKKQYHIKQKQQQLQRKQIKQQKKSQQQLRADFEKYYKQKQQNQQRIKKQARQREQRIRKKQYQKYLYNKQKQDEQKRKKHEQFLLTEQGKQYLRLIQQISKKQKRKQSCLNALKCIKKIICCGEFNQNKCILWTFIILVIGILLLNYYVIHYIIN